MKRPADFEGREESAGPLFDALRPVEQARRFLDFDVVVDPSLPPDTIACRDHTGRVVGRMVDVTPRTLATGIPNDSGPQPDTEYSTEYSGPTLADCIAHGDAEFPRELAEAKRDLGMSRAAHAAERASPGWEEQALADLRTFARTHARFAVEDFRAAFPPPEGVNPKALGSVVRRAARERIVIADGYVAVRCSNMSPRVAWKSLVYEGSPKP